MKKLQILITVLLASSLLVSACGGKTEQTAPTESSVSAEPESAETTEVPKLETTQAPDEEDKDDSAEESSAEETDSDEDAQGNSHEGFKTLSPEELQEYLSQDNTNSQSKLTVTLPLSASELTDILNSSDGETISVEAGAGSADLEIGDSFTIAEGASLVLEEGVSLTVAKGGTLNIEGTLEVRSDVTNEGSIILFEEGFLEVDGSFTNAGLLSNGNLNSEEPDSDNQNCQIVASGGITSTGEIVNTGMIDGTITSDGGTITLKGGNVEKIILNAGELIESGGNYGAVTKN